MNKLLSTDVSYCLGLFFLKVNCQGLARLSKTCSSSKDNSEKLNSKILNSKILNSKTLNLKTVKL